MSKEYLFIGGPKDGERICTNGAREILIPEFGEAELGKYCYVYHATCHPSGEIVGFYAIESLGYAGAIQKLIDNYQPKTEKLKECEEKFQSQQVDWAKEPERMAEKINFVEITHDDLASPGDFFNKAYKPTTRNLMLVFQDEE